MKRLYSLYICIILSVICGFWSCKDEEAFFSAGQNISEVFSLDEAQSFFMEKSESQPVYDKGDKTQFLSPGDIVPLWESAVPSMRKTLACYDVPFNGSYYYRAIYSESRTGAMIADRVKVHQRLIVIKDIQRGKMSQYILSLIPSKICESQSGGDILHRFVTCGNKTGFTGTAIYSCLYTSRIARVDTYVNGERVKGVFLLDTENLSEYRKRIDEMNELLSVFSLQKRQKLSTRSEYDIDGGWLDEVVITPEEPWDGTGEDGMTNEEWLESTRPDGDVDPQPGGDSGSSEDDYNSSPDKDPDESCQPTLLGFNANERSMVENAVNKLLSLLGNSFMKGINFIKRGQAGGYAAVESQSEILVFERFFSKLTAKDQPAVLYHEIYHLRNNHYNVSKEKIEIPNGVLIEPPSELKQKILDDLKEDLPSCDQNTIYGYYMAELQVYWVRYPEFYENELNTYDAEKKEFPDSTISEKYKSDRDYAIWNYQRNLELSQKYK